MAAPFQIGDLVTFDYSGGNDVNDQYPQVLCLHNDWLCVTPRGMRGVESLKRSVPQHARCAHGLNFNYLSKHDQEFIRAVLNPRYEMEVTRRDRDIQAKMEAVHQLDGLDVTSPEDFYHRWVRPFIRPRGWEPYRRYRIDKIKSVRVLVPCAIMTGMVRDSTFAKIARRLGAMRGRR